ERDTGPAIDRDFVGVHGDEVGTGRAGDQHGGAAPRSYLLGPPAPAGNDELVGARAAGKNRLFHAGQPNHLPACLQLRIAEDELVYQTIEGNQNGVGPASAIEVKPAVRHRVALAEIHRQRILPIASGNQNTADAGELPPQRVEDDALITGGDRIVAGRAHDDQAIVAAGPTIDLDLADPAVNVK